MTDYDDSELDAVLDALARPDVPANHVARVLARTSTAAGESPADTPRLPGGYLKPRWVLPVAATILAALGATWQGDRLVRDRFEAVTELATRGAGAAPEPAWRTPQEIDRPVLPPQAYWAMDPFEEFATLRPGPQEHRSTGAQEHRTDARDDGRPDAFPATGPVSSPRTAADDEATWVAVSSDLSPIDVASIAAAPLLVPPVGPLEDITPAEIPLAPIVTAPLDDQEKP
jgi:hypothetical protein